MLPTLRLFRPLRIAALLGMSFVATACSSTASVQHVNVASPPSASETKLVVAVDQTKNNEYGEALTLQNGLLRELHSQGYQTAEGGLTVHAEILGVRRGSTLANVTTGMGFGRDVVDVDVRVSDASGKPLLAFVVQGKALDKRYTDLREVLARDVPRQILEQIKVASR